MAQKSFNAPDFFMVQNLLSTEEKILQDSVRQFVNQKIMPEIGTWFDQGIFPRQLVPEFGRLGVFGSTIQGYGCAGLGDISYGLIMQELERGDSGIRSFVSVQSALCMHPIYVFGTDEQKNKYLSKMAKGEMIGCFGLTEPDFGSNLAGMAARARKDGNEYILNGSKMWITNGGIADLAIVWAKNDDGKVIGLIVEKGTKGFSTRDIGKKFSLRASVTSELIFEDCRVPATQLLQVTGLKGPLTCLNQARYGISWGAVGASMACYAEALDYAKARIQFDQPIAGFQLVQAKLVEMFTDITQAQLLCFHLGKLKEAGTMIPQQVSMAKMNNVANALKHARITRDILGASGITFEYHCGRHMLNLESVNTYEGTEDIHRLILGEYVTGIPAYASIKK